jgi:PKD repeat protein
MPADSVRWTYGSGGGLHNVVFEDDAFTEPALPALATWTRTRTFATAGTYRYYCATHGGPGGVGMAGVVHVNQTANIPPRAVLSATPSRVEVNNNVTFSAGGSTDFDGTIAKYEWDLDGNGTYEVNSGTTATTSRSYATSGPRNTKLRVTDDAGTSVESDVTAVVVTTAPTASFVAPETALSGHAVTFDASASSDADGSIATYEWDLDDNGSYELLESTATISKIYIAPQTLTISLRVTDNLGFSATTTRPLHVQAPVPPTPPAPGAAAAPPPPPVAVSASVNCSMLTGTARATCMQKACASLTGTKMATCVNNSCRNLKAAKRASCIQTSCRHVAKSKRAGCNRASCRYLTGAKRKTCLRRYAPASRRR